MDELELDSLTSFRLYDQKKESPLDLDHALEMETPGVMGLCARLCVRVQKYKKAGLGPIPLYWECFFIAYFALPERPEPRERAYFAANGDRANINSRLICTAAADSPDRESRSEIPAPATVY